MRNEMKFMLSLITFLSIVAGSSSYTMADILKHSPIDENELLGWGVVISTDELTGDKTAVFANAGIAEPRDFQILIPMCEANVGEKVRIKQIYFLPTKRVPASGQRDAVLKVRVDDGSIESFKSVFVESDGIQQIVPIGEGNQSMFDVTSLILKKLMSGKEAIVRIEIDSGEIEPIELNNTFRIKSTAKALDLARCDVG